MTPITKNVISPASDRARAEVAVVGSGPGGAVTAMRLAEAGLGVLLIEEGPHLSLGSTPHFSRKEMTQKYRGGGVTAGLGRTTMTYVEGRCVGGGSEVNRGLYHRTPPDVLESWSRGFAVEALSAEELKPHFEACEEVARVSPLPCDPPPLSRKLHEGATRLGWSSIEVPRLVRYERDGKGVRGKKESMSETFVPRFLAAGGRLMPDTRVHRLSRDNGTWRLRAEHPGNRRTPVDIEADTVFLACGAIHTPALLRRSGYSRNVGDALRFHPMIKVVACFDELVNPPGMVDPVHQIKQFDPRFSIGCSVSPRPALALAIIDHPEHIGDVDRGWQRMGIYYAQTTGGSATIRNLPGFRDPLVRVRFTERDMRDLADGLRSLCECLFAAGAVAIYPAISGIPALRTAGDLRRIPSVLPASAAGLSTLHLFSTCPMGQDRDRCVADSFGRVHGADRLHIADASLLCGPTVVNPQGSVMAVAHRNALEFLSAAGGRTSHRKTAAK